MHVACIKSNNIFEHVFFRPLLYLASKNNAAAIVIQTGFYILLKIHDDTANEILPRSDESPRVFSVNEGSQLL